MTPELDAVERAVLSLVDRGQGRWGWHELEVRLGSIDLPRRDYDVLAILKAFEERRLVERTSAQPGRWRILPAGLELLHGPPAAAPRDPAAAPADGGDGDLDALVEALRGPVSDLAARLAALYSDADSFAARLRRVLAERPDAADAVAFGAMLLSEKARTDLGRELWTSPRPEVRRALFATLRPARLELQGRGTPAFPPPAWDELLRAGLTDADAEVRHAAAALVFSSAAGADHSAALLASHDRDPDSRWTILLALGSASDAASLARLRAAAGGDDARLAAAAVRALGARRDGVADALAALDAQASDVRHAALFALGNIIEGLNDIQLAALDRAAAGSPELAVALAAYRARARHAEAPLPARSVAEEHLYFELHPHPCGQAGAVGLKHELRFEGETRVSRFVGSCPRCGGERDVWFALPPDEPAGGAFGGPTPSTLLDAGEFLTASDGWAAQVAADPTRLDPKERARGRSLLERALHALDEVLKFIPAGGAEVPPAALRSAAARAIVASEPGRFRRLRLEARRDAYRELLRAYGAAG